MGTTANAKALFMKYAEGFGLPSVSPGCIQVEAYLRMADISFATLVMKTAGTSPTGSLPAVEMKSGLGGRADKTKDDLEAAASAITFLRGEVDLDARLPGAACADCEAFNCLVDTQLAEAVRYSTWCEWASLSQLPGLYGGTLPWPLNYFIPYSQSMAMKKRFKGQDPVQIYDAAKRVLAALSRRLDSSAGPYLLGSTPCSLDARVYGLLVYIAAADTVAPVLKEALEHTDALRRYVERMSERHFGTKAPAFDEGAEAGAWSAAAAGAADGAGEAPADTPADRRERRRSYWWIGAVVALMAGYAVFGGDYVSIEFGEGEEEEDGEEE